jgi:formate dehydrogenase major subunit
LKIKSICNHCALNCGFYLSKDREIKGIDYWTDHPFNEGALCDKGNLAYRTIHHEKRLTSPLIKREGKFKKATWEEVIEVIVRKLSEIKREYGANAIRILTSGTCTNEELYLIKKFASLLGTPNVFSARPSMISNLKESFGFKAATNKLTDIKSSDCIFILGNPFEQNPVVSKYILKAKYENNAKIIVADARYTPTAWFATSFLQYKVGAEAAFVSALMKSIIEKNLFDHNFIEKNTSNFGPVKKDIEERSVERLSKITGLNHSTIEGAAMMIATAKRPAIIYTTTIMQLPNLSDVVKSLANLSLLINITKEGAGFYPIQGEANIQGIHDLGIEGRQTTRSTKEAVKALLIFGDTVASIEKPKASFVVLSQTFLSKTSDIADIVLPSACFAEKDGSTTSTDRMIQKIEKAVDPPGHARSDFWIIKRIAEAMGPDLDYDDVEAVWNEIRANIPVYRDITYKKIEEEVGVHWPYKSDGDQLYKKKFETKDGRGRFQHFAYQSKIPKTDKAHPFLVITERRYFNREYELISNMIENITEKPTFYADINTKDAENSGIKDGDIIKLISAKDEVTVPAFTTDFVPQGIIFIPNYKLCTVSIREV